MPSGKIDVKLDPQARLQTREGDVVAPFEEAIRVSGKYDYHSKSPVASELAQKRLLSFVRDLWPQSARRAIDIGCGDGEFTARVLAALNPEDLVAVDAARAAVDAARARVDDSRVAWGYASCYSIPYPDGHFDVALLMGVLHHLGDPEGAIVEALRVAKRVIIVEPNGYNPALRMINAFVPSARHFGEKAYMPRTLRRWVRASGGRVIREKYGRLVSHYWSARLAAAVDRTLQPAVESLPLVRNVLCSEFAFLAEPARPRGG